MAGKKPRPSPSNHRNGSATASNSKRQPKMASASSSGAPKPRKTKAAAATTKSKRDETGPLRGGKRKKSQASGHAATPTKKTKRDDLESKHSKDKVAKREKKLASGGAEKPAPPASTPSKKHKGAKRQKEKPAASGGSEKPAPTPTPTKKQQASRGAEKPTPSKRNRGEEETQKEAKSPSRASGQAGTRSPASAAKRKDKAAAGAGQGSCSFPMGRVRLLMRAEDAGIRPSNEAVFLINKASELFLEIFAQDAYHNALKERKKSIIYENLSTAVCHQKKYKFLSDFVPEKVAAGDALKSSLKQ